MDNFNNDRTVNIQILLGQFYKVADFQRDYVWEEDDIAQLANDIIDSMSENQEKYFLGAIVLTDGVGKYLIVDGNRFKPYKKLPHTCIIKGDGKYASIAAASILAKTHRDAYLDTLHKAYPMYGWNKNKGYGTAVHRAAIEVHGLCEHHRKSFAILPTPPHLL